MYYRRKKKPARRRPRRQEAHPDDVVPIRDPVEDRALYTITLSNPRSGRDCVITPFPGTRPGNLRVMVNGKHESAIATQTELMAWLRRKLPRTSAKRVTE
ncbi:MAG: hypothetical protein QM612_08470 [Thermomonas sp.]|uniref:hypothetical protein n=1 Tax=Thermomonas sp. TaxID=1971895 RepID=UPI0039E4D570